MTEDENETPFGVAEEGAEASGLPPEAGLENGADALGTEGDDALASAGLGDAGLGDAGLGDAGLGDAGLDPLLSHAESAALLDAIRTGSLPPPRAEQKNAQPTALGAPDAPLRRAIGKAERTTRSLANAVQGALLSLGGVLAEMQLLESTVMAVDTATGAFDDHAASWDVVAGGQATPRGLVVVGPILSERLLARRLGASDAVGARAGATRGISPLARRVLAPFATACLAPVADAFLAASGPVALVARGSTGAAVAGFSPCLRIAVRALFGEIEDEVAVLLYEEALTPRVAPGLGPSDDRDRVGRTLAEVDVDLVATLGRTHVSVGELCRWTTGSVIRLDGSPERPIEVQVDGVPVLLGMPIVHEGNVAIEVRS